MIQGKNRVSRDPWGCIPLNQLFRTDTGLGLQIVNVLGIVGEKFALLLQHRDEAVGGREAIRLRQDVSSDREEDGRVLLKDGDVEDFLWVVEAQVLELRVETSSRRAEVGDAQRRGDASAGQNNDVLGLLEKLNGIIDSVVRRQLSSLGQLAADGEDQEVPVGLVRLTLEEFRGTDAEGSKKLLGREVSRVEIITAEHLRSQGAKLVPDVSGVVGTEAVGASKSTVSIRPASFCRRRCKCPRHRLVWEKGEQGQ